MKKDILFTIILSLIGLGLGHFYLGDKKRGWTILIIQVSLIILAGPLALIWSMLPLICYIIFFAVYIWALIDAINLNRALNENYEK